MFKTKKAGPSDKEKEKGDENANSDGSTKKNEKEQTKLEAPKKVAKSDIIREKSNVTSPRGGTSSSRLSEFEKNKEDSPWKDVKLKKTRAVDAGGEIRTLAIEGVTEDETADDVELKPKKSGFWLFNKIRDVFSRKPKTAPEDEDTFVRSTSTRRSWWRFSLRKSKGKGKLKTPDKPKQDNESLEARRKAAFSSPPKKAFEVTDPSPDTTKTESSSESLSSPAKSKFTVATSVVIEKPDLVPEAKAGLEAAIDFSGAKDKLHKVDRTAGAKNNADRDRCDPFTSVMLLQIKGRRHMQVRLVKPSAESVNSGDCFILVTPDMCVQWIGTSANAFEKSKAANVASAITEKRDLGYKSKVSAPLIVEEKKQQQRAGKQFWQTLNGEPPAQEAGADGDDESHEVYMTEVTQVYHLSGDKLELLTEYSGKQPSYQMLNERQVFVFDFGSEMYVWLGDKVSYPQQKLSVTLAKDIWAQGYNYKKFDINPLCPVIPKKNSTIPVKGPQRPDWALLGKIRQGSETVLFREKFPDWPGKGGIIQAKSPQGANTVKTDMADMKPCDVKEMLKVDTSPVSLKLDDCHIGRGDTWVEMSQDLRREYEIKTKSLEVWHMEYDQANQKYKQDKLAETSHGQFHSGDAYVIRWQYLRLQKGMKTLEGKTSSRPLTTGRERIAYFYWQGKHSSIMDKGASAISTIELDAEGAPQIPIDEGKELPSFVRLFNGRMIVHSGKRVNEGSSQKKGKWRCYMVRNELDKEAYLLELPVCANVLRSRSSMLLLNLKTGSLIVWHGCKSSSSTKARAVDMANSLKDSLPSEIELQGENDIHISEREEGEETAEFWRALDSKTNNRENYISLLSEEYNQNKPFDYTPRLYQMSSVSGRFVAKEIINPVRQNDIHCPFPFVQSDLYKASQPALFLVDDGSVVYLWQGWWPAEVKENVKTGHRGAIYNQERRCACQTVLNYCKEKNKSQPPTAYLVYAGMEPKEFTNLFPQWEVAKTVRIISAKEGKTAGKKDEVEDFLKQLMRTQYTMEELKSRPLPEGVDPLRLESYLDDAEFESILGKSRDEFYSLAEWKRNELKKTKGLTS